DERNPFAPLDIETDARVDHEVAVRLVDALQRRHPAARPRRLRKGEVDPTRLRLHLDAVDPLQHFDAALDLASLRGLIPEAVDEALDLGNALRLITGLRGQELAPRLALDQVIVVVTWIQRDAARPEVGD